jgi:hypothetical protein
MKTPSDVPTITIPVFEFEARKELMPLRTLMLSLGDVGEVACGAGLGNDAITVSWKQRRFAVRGLEIIRAVAVQIDPDNARNIP